MQFRTSNPVFTGYFWNRKEFSKTKMTLNGIFFKTVFSLFLVGISVWYVWRLKEQNQDITWYLYGGMIVAVIASVITSYKQKWASVTVPIYAIAKGCFLGAITVYSKWRYQDLPQKALFYTLVAFVVMLLLYRFKIVKVTKQFRSILYSFIATIFTLYFIAFILRFFGIHFSLIYGSSWISILFSVVVISVASFSLLLDFSYIERHLYKSPKYKEWVATWGLLVTLIWMYIEIFRLLPKLSDYKL